MNDSIIKEIIESDISNLSSYFQGEAAPEELIDGLSQFLSEKKSAFDQHDKEGAQDTAYIEELKELGLFSLIIPEEYGGLALSSLAYAQVIETITRYDGSTALTVGAHSSIGLKGLVMYGTAEQKAKYLPRLCGEWLAAFCLTESRAGSDVKAMATNVIEEDDCFRLNGEKIWITNGPVAQFFTVFARDGEGISSFIVTRDLGGVTHGGLEHKMGIRGSLTSSIFFDNVAVPKENLLGVRGEGFKIAMNILNNGRTGLGGGTVGVMKKALKEAVTHTKERVQFGKSLNEFQLVKQRLLRMSLRIYATEAVVQLVAGLIDQGKQDYGIEAAIAKIYGSEAAWEVTNDALQLAGGAGFIAEYPYERMVRDCRINMIFEGANDVLRLLIGLTSMKGIGDYLKELATGLGGIASDPLKSFELIADFAKRKLDQYLPNNDKLMDALPLELQGSAEVLVVRAKRISLVIEDLVTRFKKDLVNQQYYVSKIADAIIELLVTLACLFKAAKAISDTSDDEVKKLHVNFVKLKTQECRRKIAGYLRSIERHDLDNEMHLYEELASKNFSEILGR